MASRCRSISRPAITLFKSTTISKPSPIAISPSRLPLSSPSICRPLAQMGALQSLLPLHSAVASARLTSCLGIYSNGSRSLSQVIGQSRAASSLAKDSSCSEILSYMGPLDGEQKQLIKKLVNFRMKKGKKTRVHALFYKTFHRLARTERDVLKLMVDALENIKPICEVERVGIAGTIYDVPGIVARDRQQTLAIRWVLEAAFKRRVSHRISLEKCLFDEILDAYRKRGIARKKRENLHGLAATNRSFAHFRWW